MFFLTPRLSDPFESEGSLEYPLAKLLVFTEHKDIIRRGGIASVMKSVYFMLIILNSDAKAYSRNCAFQKEAHKAILSPDTEQIAIPPLDILAPGINMLPYLLLPLAGSEEFDLDVRGSTSSYNDM